jgi:hypothetical protein
VFGSLSLRVLRDIEEAGDDVAVRPITHYGDLRSVAAPSVLVREVAIETQSEEPEKPPILAHPYFESRGPELAGPAKKKKR